MWIVISKHADAHKTATMIRYPKNQSSLIIKIREPNYHSIPRLKGA
jgi:hypothetical protein